MKKTLKKTIALTLAFIMALGVAPIGGMIDFDLFGVSVNAASESDLTFALINDGTEYEVSGCDREASGELIIPSTHNGLPVTCLEGDGFEENNSVTRVIIPESITKIYCSTFHLFHSLTSITVSSSNPNYSNDEYGVLYNKDKTELIAYPNDCMSTEVFPVPNSVIRIGPFAFSKCKNLEDVIIPNSVTTIGRYAFEDCQLTRIIIPDSVNCIEEGTFFNNEYSLKSVSIPQSVTSINENAFLYCDAITDIYYSGTEEEWNSIDVSEFGNAPLFNATIHFESTYEPLGYDGTLTYELINDSTEYEVSNCENSASGELVIPSIYNGKPVSSIGSGAFAVCESLTSISIPDSVTSIGDEAFELCNSLTSIIIPDSVTSIGDYVFSYCNSLTSITVSSNNAYYSSDEYGVLYNKDKTELIRYPIGNARASFTIPDSVTSIENNAFAGCDSLSSISIPNSVTSIGDEAFQNCNSLTSIIIPDSVTSIGDEAFQYCDGLTSITVSSNNVYYSSDEYGVLYNKDKTELIRYPIGNARASFTIPDSVTSIGYFAFDGCTSLESITIPDSVTSIGDSAFDGCYNLTSIKIPNSVTSIGNGALEFCFRLTSIIIPDSVTSIGYQAFYGCDSLTSITISNSVTSIGNGAFGGCTSLTDVYYSGTEEEWNDIEIGLFNESLTDAEMHYEWGKEIHFFQKVINFFLGILDFFKSLFGFIG